MSIFSFFADAFASMGESARHSLKRSFVRQTKEEKLPRRVFVGQADKNVKLLARGWTPLAFGV